MSAIAIFVKTPGLSSVKSRLSAGIGRARAAECHLRCARTVAAVATSAGIGPVYWAVAEADGLSHPAWAELPRLLQTEGTLGQRMRTIHDLLCQRHGAGILIGADLPQLDPDALRTAALHLDHHHQGAVLGPARDGGFWLFGANFSLPESVWLAPRYGGPSVAEAFVAAIGPQVHWLKLPHCSDLDHPADLAAVIDELKHLSAPHARQSDLLQWLTGLWPSLVDHRTEST